MANKSVCIEVFTTKQQAKRWGALGPGTACGRPAVYLVRVPELGDPWAPRCEGCAGFYALEYRRPLTPEEDEEFARKQAAALQEKKAKTVLERVEAWVNKHKVSCAESIYQRDSVQDAALDLAEELCGLVGYYKEPEGEVQPQPSRTKKERFMARYGRVYNDGSGGLYLSKKALEQLGLNQPSEGGKNMDKAEVRAFAAYEHVDVGIRPKWTVFYHTDSTPTRVPYRPWAGVVVRFFADEDNAQRVFETAKQMDLAPTMRPYNEEHDLPFLKVFNSHALAAFSKAADEK